MAEYTVRVTPRRFAEGVLFRGISCLQFSGDSRLLAVAGSEGRITLFNVDNSLSRGNAPARPRSYIVGHKGGINDVAWCETSSCIVGGGDDSRVRLFDVEKRQCSFTFRDHTSVVNAVAVNSPKGNMILSCSLDENALVWDKISGKRLRVLPAHSVSVTGGAFSHDGTLISTCGLDGLIRLWDTRTGQCLTTLQGLDNVSVGCVRFTPNSKFLLGTYFDGTMRLWDYRRAKIIRLYRGHVNHRCALEPSFINFGRVSFLFCGSENGEVHMWDTRFGERTFRSWEGRHQGMVGVATHPSRPILMSGGIDGNLTVWELEFGWVQTMS